MVVKDKKETDLSNQESPFLFCIPIFLELQLLKTGF